MKTFYLPDLGEGLPDAEIVEWHVKVGDTVKEDDPLVAMETAKAVVDVPAPFSGKVAKLFGAAGDVIETGKPLMAFEGAAGRQDTGTVAGVIEESDEVIASQASQTQMRTSPTQLGIKATPAVRALAKSLQVDLTAVQPSGPNGSFTLDDVTLAAEGGSIKKSMTPRMKGEAVRGARRTMAQQMALSHQQVVPTTVFDDVIIHAWAPGEDISVRLVQSIVKALEDEPKLNAFFDAQGPVLSVQSSVHIGLALDHEDGLFVPVIRDAESLTANSIRAEINAIKSEMQDRALSPERLSGHTIILSNFGKFAGRYATPVVVPPSVAIIAVGQLRTEAKQIDGSLVFAKTLPLSLTFDHRAVTGGEATRFLKSMMTSLAKESERS